MKLRDNFRMFFLNHPELYRLAKLVVGGNMKTDQVFENKKELLAYYRNAPELRNNEIDELLNYLATNHLTTFNYEFGKKYDLQYKVRGRIKGEEIYIIHNEQRMYIPKVYQNLVSAENYYRRRMREQDIDSPHCYNSLLGEDTYDVLIDAGAAEGIFILDNIDRVKRIIVIESDPGWISALTKTMKQIQDKDVAIYNKFLSDERDGNKITLDTLLKEDIIHKDDSILIKMDIEGNEKRAIVGAKRVLNECRKICILACTYHYHDAYKDVYDIFSGMGMNISHSRGYMYFSPEYEKNLQLNEDFVFPEFRRGIIKGVKVNG